MTSDSPGGGETAALESPRAFISAREVAARAGVSRSAVSRTFTPGASVSAETRQRVLAAAAELGYHVNHLARGLMLRETGIVCLIVSDIESPQQARLVRAITGALQDAGKVAMVLSIEGTGHDAAAALRQTLNYRADATVVMSGTPSEALVQTCLDNGQRLILINRDTRADGPDTVRLDNAGAARIALTLLIRAGCRRLAVIGTELGTPSLRTREEAFVAAARAVGLEPAVERIGLITSYDNGAAAAHRLLAATAPPDGIFCVNDVTACGVIDAARHDFALRVPEDLSVIGFDDIKQAAWLSYGLTTFSQPIGEIADNVCRMVATRAGERSPLHVELTPKLVWRRSVRVAR